MMCKDKVAANVYSHELIDDNPDSSDMCKDKVAANV